MTTETPKLSRHYKFGTFAERLDHICALFDTEPPAIEYDQDGIAIMSDELLDFGTTHEINLDWLFIGNPDGLLCAWARSREQDAEMVKAARKLEPKVRQGLYALTKAIVAHNIDAEIAVDEFGKAVRDWRQEAEQ
ncbi:MAG: hypothetical protein AB3N23_10870 [Paracoccaceae bacterium]